MGEMESTQTQTVKVDKELDFMYTGFVLIKKVHVVITFVIALIVIAVQIAGWVYNIEKINDMVQTLSDRVTVVETMQKQNTVQLQQQEAYNNIFLAELQFNLQVLMEKQGLNYKQFKMPEVKK